MKSSKRSYLYDEEVYKLTQKKGLARLLEIAGEKRGLMIISALLSSLSAVCMLVPMPIWFNIVISV
ncbi:hypothetical protein GCM10010913_16090 [Paenibacillus aceti]|uniref:Uncharacterized protein n=1 Tax=Paenibacillus aceti TaxID=1820010 RepID=A0ABQ1VSE9_9BACL|nr:hypothetical protein GCM10010913_16090 [Paenibacillus aceti]